MMDGLPESSQKAGDVGVSAGQYNLCCVSPLSFYATQGSLSSPGDTQGRSWRLPALRDIDHPRDAQNGWPALPAATEPCRPDQSEGDCSAQKVASMP
ncbi:hypothetical protein, partial [Thiolapillus sp.]|uniref:hypothetical protein n=2 Tax=Thiolapillus sp. TaxID=2017437 RepID=UPI003AF4D847